MAWVKFSPLKLNSHPLFINKTNGRKQPEKTTVLWAIFLKNKKLKTIINLLLTILIFSCTNQNEGIAEKYMSEFERYEKSKSYEILSKNYPNFTKSLDFENILQHSNNEILSFSMKSMRNEKPLGVLYFSKNSENEYKTIVEVYTHDSDGHLKEVHFNNILGQEILSAVMTKISGDFYSLNIKNQSNLSGQKQHWWACTRGCIGDAWGLCANDPECDFLCALAGGYLGCATSITAACMVWCAKDTDNDLTPEQ